MRTTKDNRGMSFWDLFPDLTGQVNVSITNPGERRGFHCHKTKNDHWNLVKGKIKVVLAYDDYDLGGSQRVFKEITLNEGDDIVIPAGHYHAFQTISDEPSVLVYYETLKSGVEREDTSTIDLDTYGGWE